VVLFLLHHRIPSDRPRKGRPIADEPLIEELGYRRPIFEKATEYFKIKHSNTVRGWWKARDKLLAGSKPKKYTPKWPQLEKELVKLFTAAREKHKIVTVQWFRRMAAEVWKWLYPEGSSVFVFSHGWFWQFLRRAGIIRWRVTKAASKPPSEVVRTVNSFIQFIRKNSRRRREGLYHATVLRSSPPTAQPPANGLAAYETTDEPHLFIHTEEDVPPPLSS
jgi:hypothetical protein